MSEKFGRRLTFGSDSDSEHFSEAETVTVSSESTEDEERPLSERKETGTQVTYRDLPRKKRSSSSTVTVRRVIRTRSQMRQALEDLDSSQLSTNQNGAPNSEFDPEYSTCETQVVNDLEQNVETVSDGEQQNVETVFDGEQERNENSSQELLLNPEDAEGSELVEREENEGNLISDGDQQERDENSSQELLLIQEDAGGSQQVQNREGNEENLILENQFDRITNSLQSVSLNESVASESSQKEQKTNDLTVNISGVLDDGSEVQPVSIRIQRDNDVGTINIRLGSLSVQRAESERSVTAETLVVPSTSYQSLNETSLARMDDTKLSSSTVKGKEQHSKNKKMYSKEKKKASKKVKKGRKHCSRRSSSSSSSYTSSSFSSSDYESTGRCYYRVGTRRCDCGDSSCDYSSYSSSEEECTCRKSKASSKKETRKNKKK